MVLESLEISSGILTKDISYLVFIFIGSPEVTDVCRLTLAHVVQAMIKSFFLGDKPLVNF